VTAEAIDAPTTICRTCGGNGFVKLVPLSLTRPWGRIKLPRDQALYLKGLLADVRDELFAEKRESDTARGQEIIAEVRTLEKVYRALVQLINEEHWSEAEEGPGRGELETHAQAGVR
jgi:hypothetical protein